MSLFRFACLIGLAVLTGACARPRHSSPPPAAAVPPAPSPPPLVSTAREALELLRTAETFDDAHVGYSGELSPYVAAFRLVLAEPDARASFHDLVDRGSVAGRLYGAAGLYFTDPTAFDAVLARIAAGGGEVQLRRGCSYDIEKVAEVIRTNEPSRIEIAKGTTLPAWFAANPRGGHCDLAGGCIPLMFVEDGRPAPR